MLHKQEVISKLHKPTNYKSNYTSTMNMKIITSLCKGIANQRDEQGWHTDFYLEVHLVATKLVPVETSSKVAAGPLVSGDPQVTLPWGVITTSSSTWYGRTTYRPSRLTLLELILVAPVGWAQYLSQILLRSTA